MHPSLLFNVTDCFPFLSTVLTHIQLPELRGWGWSVDWRDLFGLLCQDREDGKRSGGSRKSSSSTSPSSTISSPSTPTGMGPPPPPHRGMIQPNLPTQLYSPLDIATSSISPSRSHLMVAGTAMTLSPGDMANHTDLHGATGLQKLLLHSPQSVELDSLQQQQHQILQQQLQIEQVSDCRCVNFLTLAPSFTPLIG